MDLFSRMLKKWRGGWDDPRARATRGLRRMGRVAWSSSCSRNAHARKVLVRRAHLRIDQATLKRNKGLWEDARRMLEGPLARSDGRSRHASGWAAEKAARSWHHPSHPL